MATRRPPRSDGPRDRAGSRGSGPTHPRRRAKGGKPAAPRAADGTERLQKILAHAGVSSRRACEELILQGRVTVDGQVVRELGTRVLPAQAEIAVDGQPVRLERLVYFAVHKPKGYVSTNKDPSGRPRVVDLLPEVPQRVYTVGRLDEMSSGLILLTNDGELANRLTHPKFGVEKVYRVVVAGLPSREILDKLVEGVWLAEGKVRARHVKIIGRRGEATILEMALAEGKNREVRRMLAKFGHKVMTLQRVAVGPISLKGIKPAVCRSLTYREIDLLKKVAAGIPVPTGRFDHEDRPHRPLRTARRPEQAHPATGAGTPAPSRGQARPPRPSAPQSSGRTSRPGDRPRPPSSASAGPRPPQTGSRRPAGSPPRPQGPTPGPGMQGSRRPAGPPPRPQGARPGPGMQDSRRPSGPPPRPEGARPGAGGSRRPSPPPPQSQGPAPRPRPPILPVDSDASQRRIIGMPAQNVDRSHDDPSSSPSSGSRRPAPRPRPGTGRHNQGGGARPPARGKRPRPRRGNVEGGDD
ncbi:MAG: pseudouridine synthase [Isosphaeraceae bacterium]